MVETQRNSCLIFEEKLISAVFLRPFLYDKNHENHSKLLLNIKAWSEIATETGKSGNIEV